MTSFIKKEYDYAIRICAYLAGQAPGTIVPLSEISRRLFISRPFASKIVHQLIKKQVLASVQGKYGGIYLARDSHKLSVYDILISMGFDHHINECVENMTACPLSNNCKIHNFFVRQEVMLLDNFKDKKLDELAFSNKDLSTEKSVCR